MAQLITFSLGSWLPDYIPFGMPEGGLRICRNLIPYPGKFMPFRKPVRYSTNALADTGISGYETTNNDGVKYTFIGTATKLYRLGSDKTLTDVSKPGGYNTGSNRWCFEQYNQWIIATNYADPPQVIKGLTASNFQDLGGNPPRAKYVLLFKEHLIFGYINNGTVYPNELSWSARGNIEDYTQRLATGADKQPIAEIKGEITGLGHGGELFYVLSTDSITRVLYRTDPFTFDLKTNFYATGALAGSILQIGSTIYFFDDMDIYKIQNGELTSIGEGVRETILDSINQNYKYRITNAADVRNGLGFWSYASTTSEDGTPDRILCYNQKINKFSMIEIPHNCIVTARRVGVDIDGLDAFAATINTLPWSTDSIYSGSEGIQS